MKIAELLTTDELMELAIKPITPIKTQTPAQARISALQNQKDNAGAQLKAERDRQKIAKAQQQIGDAMTPKPSVT